MTQAYPLHWPPGWPRTLEGLRQESKHRFKRTDGRGGNRFWTFAEARDELILEFERIGAHQAVLSSNYEVRLDGLPRAGQRTPDDTGVAVYFTRDGVGKVMACDLHLRAEENMRSIALSISALRALERHGGGHMMTAAFQGFTALPAPGAGQVAWRQVLGLPMNGAHPVAEIRAAHARLVREAHAAGDMERLKALNVARDQGLQEAGG